MSSNQEHGRADDDPDRALREPVDLDQSDGEAGGDHHAAGQHRAPLRAPMSRHREQSAHVRHHRLHVARRPPGPASPSARPPARPTAATRDWRASKRITDGMPSAAARWLTPESLPRKTVVCGQRAGQRGQRGLDEPRDAGARCDGAARPRPPRRPAPGARTRSCAGRAATVVIDAREGFRRPALGRAAGARVDEQERRAVRRSRSRRASARRARRAARSRRSARTTPRRARRPCSADAPTRGAPSTTEGATTASGTRSLRRRTKHGIARAEPADHALDGRQARAAVGVVARRARRGRGRRRRRGHRRRRAPRAARRSAAGRPATSGAPDVARSARERRDREQDVAQRAGMHRELDRAHARAQRSGAAPERSSASAAVVQAAVGGEGACRCGWWARRRSR